MTGVATAFTGTALVVGGNRCFAEVLGGKAPSVQQGVDRVDRVGQPLFPNLFNAIPGATRTVGDGVFHNLSRKIQRAFRPKADNYNANY
jgi:hypothetical protein